MAPKNQNTDDEIEIDMTEIEETFQSSQIDPGSEPNEADDANGVFDAQNETRKSESVRNEGNATPDRSVLLSKDIDYMKRKFDDIDLELENIKKRCSDVKTNIDKILDEGRKVTHDDIANQINYQGGDRVALRLANLISRMTRKLEYADGQMDSTNMHAMRSEELVDHARDRITEAEEKSMQ